MSNSFNKWFDVYPCKDTWSADDMLAAYQAATAAADAEWRGVVEKLVKIAECIDKCPPDAATYLVSMSREALAQAEKLMGRK